MKKPNEADITVRNAIPWPRNPDGTLNMDHDCPFERSSSEVEVEEDATEEDARKQVSE